MFGRAEQYVFNYAKLPTLLLVVFSGFYLTRLVPVSPIYFVFVLSFFIVLWGSMIVGKQHFHPLSLPVIVYFLYLIVSQPFNHPDLNTLLNVLFSLAYLITILNTATSISKADLIRFSKIFILFTILLLTVEATWRLSHPVDLVQMALNREKFKDTEQLFLQSDKAADELSLSGNGEAEKNLFYAFKFSSIMFQDSNFVGTYGLIAFFFYLFLWREKFMKSSIPLYLLGFLILLTLSRSAILTIPLTLLLLNVTKKNSSIISKVLFFFLLLIGSVLLFQKVATDESFLSKFRIFSLAVNYLNNISYIDLINGIGFGNTVNYLGIGAHNLFLTHLLESGIIGLLLFLITNLMFISGSDRKSLYLTIPMFISGMSLSAHALTFYYTCLAIIYLLTRIQSDTPLKLQEESSLESSQY